MIRDLSFRFPDFRACYCFDAFWYILLTCFGSTGSTNIYQYHYFVAFRYYCPQQGYHHTHIFHKQKYYENMISSNDFGVLVRIPWILYGVTLSNNITFPRSKPCAIHILDVCSNRSRFRPVRAKRVPYVTNAMAQPASIPLLAPTIVSKYDVRVLAEKSTQFTEASHDVWCLLLTLLTREYFINKHLPELFFSSMS